jgi:hypothetical protein
MFSRRLFPWPATFLAILWQLAAIQVGSQAEPPALEEPPPAAEQLTRTAIQFGLDGETDYEQLTLRSALHEDPDYALAHWRLGKVRWEDRWLTPPEVEKYVSTDEVLAQYRKLREAAAGDPQRELSLARWCAKHRQNDLEQLHCGHVLLNPKSDPSARDEAMRRSGLQVHNGRLMTAEEARQQEQAWRQRQVALEEWTPRVEKWIQAIERGSPRARRYALEEMRGLDDPRVIPALEYWMSSRSEALALVVVSVLAGIPQQESTESLVRHAIGSASESVQAAAIDQLKQRSLHDFLPLILSQLVAPIKSTFLVQVTPDGEVRHEHELLREGSEQNLLASASFVERPQVVPLRVRADNLTDNKRRARNYQGRLRAMVEAAEMRRALAAMAAIRAMYVEHNVAKANEVVGQHNAHLYRVLQQITGEQLPSTPVAWWQWWQEYNELYAPPKPTYGWSVSRRKSHYIPAPYWYPPMSCFAAGTPVRTQSGLVPIEQVKIGDRVLSQHPDTGELTYKVVADTTERPPSPMLRVSIGEIVVQTTLGHPFWVNRAGWRMAKRMSVGDRLHAAPTASTIEAIDPLAARPAHNLVVEDFHTYFITDSNLLVHDATYRRPTRALTPGLLPP